MPRPTRVPDSTSARSVLEAFPAARVSEAFERGKRAAIQPRYRIAIALLLGAVCVTNASAQGYPGKGGGGGGGHHGGNRDSTLPACAPSNGAAGSADAFATFLGELHALRTQLLIRDDQSTAWTAMRDALRAYVEQSASAGTQADGEPLQRIRALADGEQTRATALTGLSGTLDALNRVMDEGQRRTFAQRMQADFAAAPGTR